jgi:hypothetical protein
MKKYNVGIVGYGWVATGHFPAINASSLGQVAAVCSSRKLDAGALSAQYGGHIHVVSLRGLPTQRLLDDAGISHEAVFAADRSAELGRPVKISELS